MRRLRWSNPRSVDSQGGAGSRMARGVSEVRRVQAIPRRELHVLRPRRQDLLQAGLRQVGGDMLIR